MPWARARVRVLLARASFAHDYGAGGAALFDIVNVQNWTRRRISGPFKHARFRAGSGAALSAVAICDAIRIGFLRQSLKLSPAGAVFD